MNRLPRLLALGLISALLVSVVPAVSAGDLDNDLSKVKKRIESLSDEIAATSSNRSALARDIEATRKRMDDVLASMEDMEAELLAIETAITERKGALRIVHSDLHAQYQMLALTRSELGTARDDAVRYAQDSYMGAGHGLPVVALAADAWTDIGIGLAYLEQVTADGTASIKRFESLLIDEEATKKTIAAREEALTADLAGLEQDELRIGALQDELEDAKESLDEEFSRQRTLLAKYDAQIEEIENEIGALEREQSSIKKLIAERAKPKGKKPGQLVRPVPGRISSGFGPRVHPIYGYKRMHSGVDMDGAMGQKIVAAAAGTVIFSGVKGGYGNTIMIDHGGGMVTLYAHQSKFAVSNGARVKAGQVIGYVGSTGVSTGPHLHFEVRINGAPVNPAKYI
ncbi:MAG: peptidoglycan DD-metalloendopeptidase family protein [Actinomycetota bacterium]